MSAGDGVAVAVAVSVGAAVAVSVGVAVAVVVSGAGVLSAFAVAISPKVRPPASRTAAPPLRAAKVVFFYMFTRLTNPAPN
jgi:hypothetical protein